MSLCCSNGMREEEQFSPPLGSSFSFSLSHAAAFFFSARRRRDCSPLPPPFSRSRWPCKDSSGDKNISSPSHPWPPSHLRCTMFIMFLCPSSSRIPPSLLCWLSFTHSNFIWCALACTETNAVISGYYVLGGGDLCNMISVAQLLPYGVHGLPFSSIYSVVVHPQVFLLPYLL